MATRSIRRLLGGAFAAGLAALATAPSPALAASLSYRVGAISDISARCGGQNAEVEAATDPLRGYAYEAWIGCDGIGFARSTDRGAHFGKPMRLPGSGSLAWDPAVTVAANGTVYAAFMVIKGTKAVPVVVASFDHGRTFPQKTVLDSPRQANWGDRDFIATGPGARVYLTWDYGPSSSGVTLDCGPEGSCAITAGEVNVVIQSSTNGGKSFGPMVHVSPGFPASGGESAPLLVEASGRIDVLYTGSRVLGRRTHSLGAGHNFFTSSVDGRRWTKPVELGHSSGSISPREWWIDGAISGDAAGNLYATWDTQSRGGDSGWLAYSTDHGVAWSKPIRVTVDRAAAPHIVQSAGGPAGIAYVGWLEAQRPWGYAEFLRTFSITRGWLSAPRQISRRFGARGIWPGDTFGIATLSPTRLVLSWGSAIRGAHRNSEIFAAPLSVTLG